MKKLLLATIAFGVITSTAKAADLPVKAPYASAPSIFSWNGWYLGAHVGAGQHTSDAATNGLGAGTSFPFMNNTGSGMLGGVQAGYNAQFGWAVFGLEGAFSWSGIKVDGACLAILTCTVKDNWIASISGRVGGLVTDRFLAYVKGGAAWKDTDYSFASLAILTGNLSSSSSDTRFGYLFGFGGEYKFTQNWSGFVEYNYMDFGRNSYDVNSATAGTAQSAAIKDTVHVMKTGVNYKF